MYIYIHMYIIYIYIYFVAVYHNTEQKPYIYTYVYIYIYIFCCCVHRTKTKVSDFQDTSWMTDLRTGTQLIHLDQVNTVLRVTTVWWVIRLNTLLISGFKRERMSQHVCSVIFILNSTESYRIICNKPGLRTSRYCFWHASHMRHALILIYACGGLQGVTLTSHMRSRTYSNIYFFSYYSNTYSNIDYLSKVPTDALNALNTHGQKYTTSWRSH